MESWAQSPELNNPGMAVHTYNLSTWVETGRSAVQKFKVILHITSWKPDWTTWDPVNKQTNKKYRDSSSNNTNEIYIVSLDCLETGSSAMACSFASQNAKRPGHFCLLSCTVPWFPQVAHVPRRLQQILTLCLHPGQQKGRLKISPTLCFERKHLQKCSWNFCNITMLRTWSHRNESCKEAGKCSSSLCFTSLEQSEDGFTFSLCRCFHPSRLHIL